MRCPESLSEWIEYVLIRLAEGYAVILKPGLYCCWFLILPLLFLISWLQTSAATSPVLSGIVERVIDGDTVDVKLDSGLIRIRLNAVDAPEKSQPWGKEAAAYLSQRIINKQVDVEPFSQDRYERLIGALYLDGVNINSELVEHGHAWAFRHYMKKSDSGLCTIEFDARKAKRGLWSLKRTEIISPWEFRQRKDLKVFTDYSNERSDDCVRAVGKR
jgi:endonuclease YncB( thermonuclease family)